MLASISPLGERARTSRWSVTVVAYLLGSSVGGAALGAMSGLIGSLLPYAWRSSGAAAAGLGLLLALGLALDLRLAGARLPAWRRQVDEAWLDRYRGWVYGVGFGAQLGFGLVTIVTSATVYAVALFAALSCSGAVGMVIGVVFGAIRALPVVTLARVHDRAALHRVFRRLEHWGPRADRLAHGSLAGASVALVAAAVVVS